ncbi:MAG TPA: YfhO family protein [Candidatus Limnocylindrales bacterium]
MARHAERSAAPAASDLATPPRPTLWASLVYAIATLTLAFPALTGAFLLNPTSDQYKAGYAFREFAAEHLRSGRGFPQWNPYLEGGLPYVAAMHGDIFYPTFLLRMIVPTDVAMTWEFPIHLFLCGLLTYLFLRAWNFGFYGALIGGLAYMLGGSIAGYAGPGHDGKMFVSTMLPLALLMLTRAMRDGRMWAWGGLAITIGLAVLSPHPQLLQYLLLTTGAFALYIAFAHHPVIGQLPRATAINRLVYATGAVALGILMGAVQYWPALFEYKPWSPRAGGHDYATAVSYSFPIEELLNAYWPHFSGILDNYWGRNFIHFHSDYFGVIVLILVGCAFGQWTAKSFRRFWLITAAISLLWALGGYTPFFKLILAIPLFGAKYFRAPSTMIYVTAFSVSVLAAIGMERLLARRVSPKYAVSWAAAALVFAVLMSVGGYTALSNAVLSTFDLPPQAIDVLQQRASANTGPAILGVWRSCFFVLVGAGIVWALLTDRLASKATAIGLVAVLIIDLWTIERRYWTFLPPAKTLYATDPAIEAIKADIAKTGEPGRVWTEERLGQALRDPAFAGDALMSHGLRLVGVYHGNELGMYQELLGNPEYRESQVTASPEFWRHENVRYLYTVGSDSAVAALAAGAKWPGVPTRIAGPVRDAAGNMVFAYKLPGDIRTAWVATAMTKASENQAIATVLDPRFDPRRVAIIDTSASDIQAPALQGLPEPSTTRATVTKYTDESYDISLDQPARAGSALIVSENYFPGWRATADGKPVPVARANFNLIGVALPEGARTIQLRFTDAAYQKGKVLTLAALAVALLVLVLGIVVDRRRMTLNSATT